MRWQEEIALLDIITVLHNVFMIPLRGIEAEKLRYKCVSHMSQAQLVSPVCSVIVTYLNLT